MNGCVHRRDSLKLGCGALALASAGNLLRADEPSPKKRDLRKAIMYATLGFKGSVLEKFRAVKTAGFAGVEPMSHMNQEEVAEALAATELKAASVCCDSHWKKPLSHPDEKIRAEGLEGLLQALKDAQRYGATSVLLVPGIVNQETDFDACWSRSIAEIRKAIPVAKDLGVKIAVENVWNNFITKPEQARKYLDEIDSQQVGWHFDIGNVIKYSPPETWIPILGKSILKLHVKEYGVDKKFSVRLFEGDNNWPKIMQALDDIGYTGWGIAEQPNDQSQNLDALGDLGTRMDKAFAS